MLCHVTYCYCSSNAPFHVTCSLPKACKSAGFWFFFSLPVILFTLLDHVVKPESSFFFVCSVCPLLQMDNKSSVTYWPLLLNRIREEEFLAGQKAWINKLHSLVILARQVMVKRLYMKWKYFKSLFKCPAEYVYILAYPNLFLSCCPI